MKAILKKVVGLLKIATVALPVIATALSINMMVQGFKLTDKADAKEEAAKQNILNSQAVVELRERDLEVLNNQYESDLITAPEYMEKQNYINSTEYVDDVIDMPGLEDQKAILKQAEDVAKKYSGWGLGITLASAVPIAVSITWAGYSCLSRDGRAYMGSLINDGIEDLKYKDPNKPKKKKKEESEALEIKY